jgi:hypothetical protein
MDTLKHSGLVIFIFILVMRRVCLTHYQWQSYVICRYYGKGQIKQVPVNCLAFILLKVRNHRSSIHTTELSE